MVEPLFDFFEVGGCIRDELLGFQSKDVDFSVVAQPGQFTSAKTAFFGLSQFMEEQGFTVFESRSEFLTLRAKVPQNHPLRQRTDVADFVLARKDGPSSDGRRPDWVEPGSLLDDLSRRDFTVNAIARAVDGSLIDPFGGLEHIKTKQLVFVGNPTQRIGEDGLRVLRAFRFAITKGMLLNHDTKLALSSEFAAEMLHKVSVERIREEMNKMFKADTLATLQVIQWLPSFMVQAIFRDGLRLDATLAR